MPWSSFWKEKPPPNNQQSPATPMTFKYGVSLSNGSSHEIWAKTDEEARICAEKISQRNQCDVLAVHELYAVVDWTKPIFDANQACQYLGISRTELYRRVKAREISAVNKDGNMRFRKVDLERAIEGKELRNVA